LKLDKRTGVIITGEGKTRLQKRTDRICQSSE